MMESDHDGEHDGSQIIVLTATDKQRHQERVLDEYIQTKVGNNELFAHSSGRDRFDEHAARHADRESTGVAPAIINTPRDYQLELFERAKHENLIAVLDTGSGKTLIAVLLLRWMIDQELEARARGRAPKIAFFVVDSVNLVVQQSEVLRANLSHPIAHLYGAMNTDTWSRSIWSQLYQEHKIIVLTADILLDCLSRNLLNMSQINLLVLDEAHHAKKNHPFARIVQDHYARVTNTADRPRIFAMTASPVDTKTDVAREALLLERMLHSKIVTAGNMTSFQQLRRPEEHVLVYDSNEISFMHSQLQHLKLDFSQLGELMPLFEIADKLRMHLGEWCARRYLSDIAAPSIRQKMKSIVQADLRDRLKRISVADQDIILAEYDRAFDRISETCSPAKHANAANFSPKVEVLSEFLRTSFDTDPHNRCLVFVTERSTARMLKLAIEHMQHKNIKVDYLTGIDTRNLLDAGLTVKQQNEALRRFRRGDTNCLFVTSVGEEGLDIPQCNLVIRFDLYQTMIQYIQSRGRARRNHSIFVNMAERDNNVHRSIIKSVRAQEASMRAFCTSLPTDRRLLSEREVDDQSAKREKKTYYDPQSGAKLDFDNALIYLANLVSVMSTGTNEVRHPSYCISSRGLKFVAEVTLPRRSPLAPVFGEICSRRKLARQSAAFEACLELRKGNYLNEYFVPTYFKRLPAMRNALLAVDTKAKHAYPMLTKPSIWNQGYKGPITKCWITLLEFAGTSSHLHLPLALVTRMMMPQIPAIPLFDKTAARFEVICSPNDEPVEVSEAELDKLGDITLMMFQDIFSKTYEKDVSKLPYFVVPAKNQHGMRASGQTVDWTLIDKMIAERDQKWDPSWSREDLMNKLLVDPLYGVSKFIVTNPHSTFQPSDPVPLGICKAKDHPSILDFSTKSQKVKARAHTTWNHDQPVLVARAMQLRRNLLSVPSGKEAAAEELAYICPEPFVVSSIPPDLAQSYVTWPSIIWRLDSVLIANEACSHVGIVCRPDLALAAVTKDSSDDETEIQQSRGMGENYERLEFLGDCFLKFATSLSVLVRYPNGNECEYHNKRMLMLCNKNLLAVSKKLDLTKYIRSKAFSRRLWYPEGLDWRAGGGVGTASHDVYHTQKQNLSDKTIADVSEALIGAAYLTHNMPGNWNPSQWTDAITAVAVLVESEDHTMRTMDDYRKAYQIPEYQIAEANASQRESVRQIGRIHHYNFKSPTLLRSAFLHPSIPFMWEQLPSYQQLEFFGDSLLDLVSVSFLFYKFPDKGPQWLTEAKMVMVSNRFLGMLACELGLHKHLRHNDSSVEGQIRSYFNELEEAKAMAQASRQYWDDISEPPKCLADIVESFIGALFIDSNFDYNEVQRFFDEHIKPFFEDMLDFSQYVKGHPVTQLHHLLHSRFGCTAGRVLNKELAGMGNAEPKQLMTAVMVHSEIIAHSTGTSTKYASVRAASIALDILTKTSVSEYRSKYNCDCTAARTEAAP